MAHVANYFRNGHAIENAYVRVERLWGSKRENWTGLVAVYRNETEATSNVPHIDIFNVTAAYVQDENPFAALYRVLETYPGIITPKDPDPSLVLISTEQVVNVPGYDEPEIPEVKEKKPRVKKVKDEAV
jgi:hypothetical protein